MRNLIGKKNVTIEEGMERKKREQIIRKEGKREGWVDGWMNGGKEGRK